MKNHLIPVTHRSGSAPWIRRVISRSRRDGGFVLVAVLMMMILLVVAAVGLLSLSTVALRTTTVDGAAKIAKANARMALQMALGDMQKYLGSDQRVTADASILSETAPRPHMVGVWDSQKDTKAETPMGTSPSYDKKDPTKFKGWLVSKTNTTTKESPDYGTSEAGADGIPMFFDGLDGYDMKADLVKLQDSKNQVRGGVAWAVSQAATKASINTGGEFTTREINDVLQVPDRPNLELSGIAKQPTTGWDKRHSTVLSMKQAFLDSEYNLSSKASVAELSVEHTAKSLGVLADVAKGGLKTDLSLGLDLDRQEFAQASWSGFDNPFHGNGPASEKPLYNPATSAVGTVNLDYDYEVFNYIQKMDTGAPPTFDSLRSYYSMYKHMYTKGGVPTARQRFQASPYYDSGAPRGSETSMSPVLDRVMLYFSLTVGVDEFGATDYIPALLVTPVVTLWNPYNVAIESDGYVVYPWMDLPMEFQLDVNGKMVDNGRGSLSRFLGRGRGERADGTTWIVGQHGRQAEPYFYCKITQSGHANTTDPIRLEPGEVKMFVCSEKTADNKNKMVVGYLRESNDADPSRVVFMKPYTGGAVNRKAGLRIPLKSTSDGKAISEVLDKDKSMTMMLSFNPGTYHYFVSLEDATRIQNPRAYLPSEHIRTIMETQIVKGQGGYSQFVSPSMKLSDLPKAIGVLETYHRTAGNNGTVQAADLVYTVNPRHRYTNYTISGSNSMPNAHYGTELKQVSVIDVPVDIPTGRPFYGLSNGTDGESTLPFFDVPKQPMMSIGAFQNADLSNSAFSPSSQFGNSWASPYMPITDVAKVMASTSGSGLALSPQLGLYDHSYLLNTALWDQFYFSSIAPGITLGTAGSNKAYDDNLAQTKSQQSKEDVVKNWIKDPRKSPLRNTRHILYKGGVSDEDLETKLLDPAGCREAAAHMLVDGSFNVNSTNVKAWAAMLASLRGQEFQISTGASHGSGDKTPIVRLSSPTGEADNLWNGFREISDSDIELLAEKIVEQVRERGPFQSLSEFVNRRLEGGELGKMGALQAAIEKSLLNKSSEVGTFVTSGYPVASNITQANTGVGTPGWITQADLLNPLAPFISVRSDTFTIRAYGDARDPSGNVLARAYCEAVVQRVPDFVDSEDVAASDMADINEVNKTFGRKFEIVSIREVSQLETEI